MFVMRLFTRQRGTTRESTKDTILLFAINATSERPYTGDDSVSVIATILAFFSLTNFAASIVIFEYLG
jgi:hypothetical protein